MEPRTLKFVVIAALLSLAASSQPATAEQPTASAVVETLHASLLEVMRDAEALGFSGRYEKLSGVVANNFDFLTIAKVVTGRNWKTASDDQKRSFLEVFQQLSTATYASNFSGYGGEQFRTVSTEPVRGGTVVKTELVKTGGEAISLNYMLRESNERWQIVNVTAQGVSDLSLKRAEYTAVINSEGLDSLVEKLRSKVSQMGR